MSSQDDSASNSFQHAFTSIPSPHPATSCHQSQPTLPVSSLNNQQSHIRTVAYFMTIHFLLAFTEIILVAPLIVLFERSVCREYYDGFGWGRRMGSGNEYDCKVIEVQERLAKVRGTKAGLDGLVVLVVAIPFGRLGDRIGRKKILAFALIGVVASFFEIGFICAFPGRFDIKLVWLSSALLLCGGGLNTSSAYMWAMAGESIRPEKRSHGYYYIFSAFYLAELLASFTASVTTETSPWIPFGLAISSLLLCLALLVFVRQPSKHTNPASSISQTGSRGVQVPEEDLPLLSKDTSNTASPRFSTLLSLLKQTNIWLLLPAFLVGIFRYPTLNLLIQYASVRFGIPVAKGAIFYTQTAVVNIFLFLFLVPRLSAWLNVERSLSSERIDRSMVQASLGVMFFGTFVLGTVSSVPLVSFGVFIFSIGFGSRVSALSLVTHWIPDSSKATVYAAIVVMESAGHAIGDPALLWVYAWGLKRSTKVGGGGESWQAVGFWFASALYALATLSSCFISLEQSQIAEGQIVSYEE